jgi:putative glutamine amidotransferase
MVKPLIGITCFSVDVPCSRSVLNQQYVDAVAAAGGAPIGIPLGLDQEALAGIYEMLDGLLLPGGGDVAPARYGELPDPNLGNTDEARDELELTLVRWALEDGLPVLGICRGIQVLAVAAGGSLYQDLPTQWDSDLRHEVREFGRDHLAHAIALEPGSRLAAVLGCTTAQVNSFHHQAVRRMPEGFVASARAPDGLVEGIEAVGDRFVVAVQCHPESMWASTAPEFARLFTAFVEAARQRSAGLRSSA